MNIPGLGGVNPVTGAIVPTPDLAGLQFFFVPVPGRELLLGIFRSRSFNVDFIRVLSNVFAPATRREKLSEIEIPGRATIQRVSKTN